MPGLRNFNVHRIRLAIYHFPTIGEARARHGKDPPASLVPNETFPLCGTRPIFSGYHHSQKSDRIHLQHPLARVRFN